MWGLFLLEYVEVRVLELFYKVFGKFCNINNFEVLAMDTDSL